MKWQLFIMIFVLILPIINAGEITLVQSTLTPGETLMAYVNTSSLSSSQISVLDNSSSQVSISPLIKEYRDDQYFFYFNLPTTLESGTYNVLAGSKQTNFTVKTSPKALQIKPSIVILESSKSNFNFELTNVGESITATITSTDSEIDPRKSSLSFSENEEKNLYVDYSYSQIKSDSTIIISYGSTNYAIPIIYPDYIVEEIINETVSNETIEITNTTQTVNITKENIEGLSFLVSSPEASIETTVNETFEAYLILQNNLNETITSIEWTLSGNLKEVTTLNTTSLEELDGNATYSQYLWFNLDGRATAGVYTGNLTASSEVYSVSIPITLTVSQATVEEKILEPEVEEKEETQEVTNTYEEPVSFKETTDDSNSNNSEVIVGIILILILIAIFLVLFLKLRQGNEKNFNRYVEETRKK
jgi:hypothetical protein